MSDLTAVSLFAGIGGFDLALKRAGVRTAASVEIDPDCRGVLRRHFPETALFSDVTEVTGDQLRAAGFVPGRGILTAGWPCQGNSVAGRRSGMADPRSGLWRHVVRLVAETRPRWFLGENVPGLLSINGGRDFGTVIRDLDDLGYGVAWRVLDAQWLGVPQRRRRVFVAGCLGDPAGPVQVLLEPESGAGHSPQGTQPGARIAGTLAASSGGGGLGGCGQSANAITNRLIETASTLQGGGRRGHRVDAEGAAGGHLTVVPLGGEGVDHALTSEGADASEDGTGRGTPIVAYALTSRNDRNDREENYVTAPTVPESAVRRLTPRECERLQGFPDDWTRRLDDGTEQSDSARYRQCGNAVAVPVAEWIARRVVAADQASAAEGAA